MPDSLFLFSKKKKNSANDKSTLIYICVSLTIIIDLLWACFAFNL